jgi:hypothetical protein
MLNRTADTIKVRSLAQEVSENLCANEIFFLIAFLQQEYDRKIQRHQSLLKRDREITLNKKTDIHPICKY